MKSCILLSVIFLLGCAGTESTLQKKIRQIMAPSCKVLDRRCDDSGIGSATIVSSKYIESIDKYENVVITNHHVIERFIEDPSNVVLERYIFSKNGYIQESERYRVFLTFYNKKVDVAILEFYSDEQMPCAKISDDDIYVKLFDKVIIVGCQLGENPSHTVGEVGEVLTHCNDLLCIKINAPIIYGNSGGACFIKIDRDYYYIGIPSRIGVLPYGRGFVVQMCYISPWTEIKKVLIEEGYWPI